MCVCAAYAVCQVQRFGLMRLRLLRVLRVPAIPRSFPCLVISSAVAAVSFARECARAHAHTRGDWARLMTLTLRPALMMLQAEAVLGAIGGGTGAFLTTPFDIVTTRIIASTESGEGESGDNSQNGDFDLEEAAGLQSPGRVVRGILAESGPAGLFQGSLQRTLYWAPAVGIFLSTYCFLRQFALTLIK